MAIEGQVRLCRRCGEMKAPTMVSGIQTRPELSDVRRKSRRLSQFHYRDRDEKNINISRLAKSSSSKEQVLAEIAKCQVLCANCHAKHHAE